MPFRHAVVGRGILARDAFMARLLAVGAFGGVAKALATPAPAPAAPAATPPAPPFAVFARRAGIP